MARSRTSAQRARPALVLVAALTAVSHAAPREALADKAAEDLDALRRRFAKALALEDKGDFAGARAELASIAEVKLTAQVQFHLALCDEQLGKLATALRGFEQSLELAKKDPEASADVLENAPLRIASLVERTPRLVLVVEEQGSAELSIDGGPTQTVAARLELRLDPGKHSVSVKREGQAPFTREFSSEEASTTEFTIPRSKPAVPVVAPPPPPKEEIVVEPGDPIPGVVVGATGLALLVGGGVFLGLRQATIAKISDTCDDQGQNCAPSTEADAERGRVFDGLTWGLGAAGLAALGVGAALFFTIGQDTQVTRTVTARAGVGPGGLWISGSFD
jgi:hypothetical protein